MNASDRCRHGKRITITLMYCMALLLATMTPGAFGETTNPSLSTGERLQLGERMYREGILPSGKPMQAFVKGDLPVDGTAFSCVSCHLRSGLGSTEGGVITPPTTGNKLFQPLQVLYKGMEQNPKYFPPPPRRPAYTDDSLAEVIQGGVDPAGRILNDVMPRYPLEKDDMALLIAYLKTLSAQFSPGVTDSHLSLATIITDEVSPEDRDAMLAPLDNYINIKNNQVKAFKKPSGARSRLMAENMMESKELALRTLSLSRWIMKGPPETWRNQLEEYNRKEPVFALIGGITTGEWQPIHQFSEDNHIPCLFPGTDFPVISPTDWYTLYLSKGYYQEGESAARYLNDQRDALKGKPLVQIVRASREGHALSAGFLETWRDLGHEAPVTVTLNPGEKLTGDIVQQLLAREKPAAIILWDGTAALPTLETLAAGRNRPDMVLVSAGYLGKSIWSLKGQVRAFTYLTYPYRLPRLPQDKSAPMMGNKIFSADSSKTANQSYALIEVLTMALMEMKGNYYRDNFLDVTGMLVDQEVPLYERLSFGPGQRYASKGCYIVQLTKEAKPDLLKRSDWVIH